VGLPVNIESFGIIYNKTLFEQAGITAIPKTYTELEAVCKTLQEHSITPFANGYKELWILFTHQVNAYIAAEGGSADEIADKINKGTLSFSTMKYFDNYLRYLDLTMKYCLPKPLETGWEEEETSLATGKAAMIHMGAWCEPTLIKANADVKLGFIPMPISDDPSEARICSDVSWVAKVSSTTKYKDAAVRAIDYFLTSDSGLNYTAKSGMVIALQNVPVARSGQLTSEAANILAASPVWNWPFNSWPNGFGDSAGATIQKYLAKEIDAATVKSELDKAWKDLVANK
jgi:raffinose/stachyose/melibiose transport system substrate-binding protein